MNAIPDPVEFKPEHEGATPADRATFAAIYRIEKCRKPSAANSLCGCASWKRSSPPYSATSLATS
jgi:hypothetical protein